jgi:hypothetical protein
LGSVIGAGIGCKSDPDSALGTGGTGAIGAGGNNAGGIAGAGAAGAAGATGGGGACNPGSECFCSDGRRGTNRCETGSAVCSCDGCPPLNLAPQEPGVFSACGGFPAGRWRAKRVALGPLTASITAKQGAFPVGVGECPVEIPQPSGEYDLRLELFEGGAANVAFEATLAFNLAESCVSLKAPFPACQPGIDTGTTFYSLHVPGFSAVGSCKSLACGICSCSSGAVLVDNGRWSRSGTTLTVVTNPGSGEVTESYEYCVQGDTMTLRNSFGFVIEMERSITSGTPAPCANRSEEQCALGGGCALGVCVGNATCSSAESEAGCSTLSGCSWASEQCGGTAPAACKLEDFGVVPGCTIGSGKASCVGDPGPCTAKTEADCLKTPGCQRTPGCIGGTFSCGRYTGACSFCNAKVGCSCNVGYCEGSATCEAQQLSECEAADGCSWVECQGTPTPCAQFDELTCGNVSGCRLQMPPVDGGSDSGSADGG